MKQNWVCQFPQFWPEGKTVLWCQAPFILERECEEKGTESPAQWHKCQNLLIHHFYLQTPRRAPTRSRPLNSRLFFCPGSSVWLLFSRESRGPSILFFHCNYPWLLLWQRKGACEKKRGHPSPGLDQAYHVTAMPLLDSQGSAHPPMHSSKSTHSIQQIFITHLLCDRHCARCWGVLKCTKDFGFNSGSVRLTDQEITAPKRQFLTPISKSYRFHSWCSGILHSNKKRTSYKYMQWREWILEIMVSVRRQMQKSSIDMRFKNI